MPLALYSTASILLASGHSLLFPVTERLHNHIWPTHFYFDPVQPSYLATRLNRMVTCLISGLLGS